MKQELMNLFLFIAICFAAYILFRHFEYKNQYGLIEGMTNGSGAATTTTSSTNGVAGNAASYGATIKAANIKMQDTFLISKYRSDYETAILNLDDLLSSLMLQTALTVDTKSPQTAIKQLAEMNEAKTALNTVMKYVDKQ
jgi:hypothetical protein